MRRKETLLSLWKWSSHLSFWVVGIVSVAAQPSDETAESWKRCRGSGVSVFIVVCISTFLVERRCTFGGLLERFVPSFNVASQADDGELVPAEPFGDPEQRGLFITLMVDVQDRLVSKHLWCHRFLDQSLLVTPWLSDRFGLSAVFWWYSKVKLIVLRRNTSSDWGCKLMEWITLFVLWILYRYAIL